MTNQRIGYRKPVIFAGTTLFGLYAFGFIGISYWRPVENDPFKNGVEVKEVKNDYLTLADGRVLRVIGGVSERSLAIIKESASRVDVEIDESNLVTIYGRGKIFRCGISLPMIVLPIIPINVPKYNRTMLEIGEFEGLPRRDRFKPCPEHEQCGSESKTAEP